MLLMRGLAKLSQAVIETQSNALRSVGAAVQSAQAAAEQGLHFPGHRLYNHCQVLREVGYQQPVSQYRSYHQDQSSVGELTAEDIEKTSQSKGADSKPHKQMVTPVPIATVGTHTHVNISFTLTGRHFDVNVSSHRVFRS
ncbi:hypothetical protein XENOCAPTIV_013342 [Xenoophorus captivus]|uniref:Uncharacterized protein n=1 Tax=Xenoophorus captivus TaxID=1517983 RepID=A0ABV0QJB2_9TELE